ncbi:hypothetical protein ASE06_10095 [Sphingopyxis sp. Root214]|uniref:hypothetical protein n=1 Tax=unclassified Sphingopyxis TaxID=2614943 RepID=UPI0006F503B3|nr:MULTISPECIES: hypothetical protein [unclassified Sphingopyxis]KQZ72814.1 hypothetical protein ASD73_07740 [Sphingopyxis sp. Root154]KRC06961.1 hypothetical protein ASE06_10095 [Sphingopyxis sp. Root214]
MTAAPDPLESLRAASGLEQGDASHWTFRIGRWRFRLPNFAWRQAAIDAHDRHHLITGYPLTLTGEIQLAAWEWGAGRYPDWRATLFCSPLIVAGVIALPRRTWRAYAAGRQSESLYRRDELV